MRDPLARTCLLPFLSSRLRGRYRIDLERSRATCGRPSRVELTRCMSPGLSPKLTWTGERRLHSGPAQVGLYCVFARAGFASGCPILRAHARSVSPLEDGYSEVGGSLCLFATKVAFIPYPSLPLFLFERPCAMPLTFYPTWFHLLHYTLELYCHSIYRRIQIKKRIATGYSAWNNYRSSAL